MTVSNFQIIDTDGVLVRCPYCFEEEDDGWPVKGQYWQHPWYDNVGIETTIVHGRMECPDCFRKFHLEIVEDN